MHRSLATPSPASGRRSRSAAIVAVLLLAACQPGPSPAASTTTAESTPAPTASQVASATSPLPTHDTAAPTPPPPPAPLTGRDKILAALAIGSIDAETALVYRVFGVFGDPRLPEALRGVASEDMGALLEARQRYDGLSDAMKGALRPYLVRPTHPESYWNVEPPTASVQLAAAHLPSERASTGAAAPGCTNGWMSTQVSASIPVMIWSQCFGSALAAQAAMEEARGYMAALWQPETSLMVVPPGDQNFPNDGYDDMPETGDGLIDIYLLDGFSPSGHVRDFNIGTNYGVASWTPPFEGSDGSKNSSAYLIIKPGLRGLDLETTLAHEFFHALQFAINFEGMTDCPLGSLGNCPGAPQDWFWMTEASATWAEHRFVPAARATVDGPYDRYQGWRKTNQGLSQVGGINAYYSWMWPLFMQQQAGAASVGTAWRAFRGKHGWNQLQAALDGVVPFEQFFREYAVRGWNELLNPGDPLVHHYFDQALDGNFPRDQPEDDRLLETIQFDADDTGPSIEYLVIDSLAPKYLAFFPGADAHTLVFDFAALAPEIDVDAIVRLEDNSWERRELPRGQVTWCLDKPADSVQEGILVFSNHDQHPGITTRTWSWDATSKSCGVPVGTLAYSFLDTAPIISQPGGHQAYDATVQVRLKLNEHIADPYSAMYLNDGSTYGVQTSTKSLLAVGPDGCQPNFVSTGTPGGSLEIDSVVGNTWIDENGKNRLTLGISLPVHVESTEDWCPLGIVHSSNETSVEYPACDGMETSSTPTSQTFVFECDFQGTSQSWSVNGTIVLNR